MMRHIRARTTTDVYMRALNHCVNFPDLRSSPRRLPIRESLNVVIEVTNPSNAPIVTKDNERNEKIARYTAHEFAMYDSGTRDAEAFAQFAPFWRGIANPDGTVNSAYGYLIWFEESYASITPWEWCIKTLIKDKESRQAVLHFARAEFYYAENRDIPCTLTGTFHIRENKLHFTVVMRSNDIVLGLVYDMPWFCHLQHRMHQTLHSTYPHLELGEYTHIAQSLHLYEKDVDIALKMLGEK